VVTSAAVVATAEVVNGGALFRCCNAAPPPVVPIWRVVWIAAPLPPPNGPLVVHRCGRFTHSHDALPSHTATSSLSQVSVGHALHPGRTLGQGTMPSHENWISPTREVLNVFSTVTCKLQSMPPRTDNHSLNLPPWGETGSPLQRNSLSPSVLERRLAFNREPFAPTNGSVLPSQVAFKMELPRLPCRGSS